MELHTPRSLGTPHPLAIHLERHGDFVAFYEVLVEGGYRRLLDQIVPGDVVVDAGANIGLFSLLASARVGSDGSVLAMEPNPENYQRLSAHVGRNHCRNVRVFPYALGAPGQSDVWMVGEGIRAQVVEGLGGQYSVHSVTVDELVREQGLRPTVLKMDIEGSEREAFGGLKESLRSIRAVTIEIHDPIGEGAVRSALSDFRIERVARPRLQAYARFGLHHPLLLSRLEWGNHLLSVRRLLRDRGDVGGSDGIYPVHWYASRAGRS